jgi:hypothetical protein
MKVTFLFIAFLSCVNLVCQKSILFVDKLTNEPIDFMLLYSKCNTATIYSDHSGLIVLDTTKFKCNNISIEHLNYATKEFNFNQLKLSDTIKLVAKLNILEEVKISSPRDLTKQWINLLNGILKKYQKDKRSYKDFFHYNLLTVNFDKEVIEEIKADLEITYSKSSGFYLENDYIKTGAFGFHTKTPFLNLNTEKLILAYSPFSKKNNTDLNYLPFNSQKINTKNLKIYDIHCDHCKENEILLKLIFENNVKCQVLLDTLLLEIRELQYDNINFTKVNLWRLDNTTFSFDNGSLYFTFDSTGVALIKVKLQPVASESKIQNITLSLIKYRSNKDRSYLKVLGDYTPDNIYENIILNPDNLNLMPQPNETYMDVNDQDVIFSKQFLELNSKGNLKSIIKLKNSSNRFNIWDYKNTLTYPDYTFVSKGSYFDNFGKFVKLKTELRINWFIQFQKVDNEFKVYSLPSFWNIPKSSYVEGLQDTLYNDLFSNLIFDYYEAHRQILMDSLKDINITNSNINLIMDLFDKRYQSVSIEVNHLLEIIQSSPILPLQSIDVINNFNIKILGSDRIKESFNKEFNILIQIQNINQLLILIKMLL